MKKIFVLFILTLSLSVEGNASGKSELFKSLRNVILKNMDEGKLIGNFNEALMTTRHAAIESSQRESTKALLAGSLQDKSHFVIEMTTTVDDNKTPFTVLRLSSNTQNPALFSDMFATLQTSGGFPRRGEHGERIGVFKVDTQRLSEISERLLAFMSKAKSGTFNTQIQTVKTRSATILPFPKGSK